MLFLLGITANGTNEDSNTSSTAMLGLVPPSHDASEDSVSDNSPDIDPITVVGSLCEFDILAGAKEKWWSRSEYILGNETA